jgi:hypothetical protein
MGFEKGQRPFFPRYGTRSHVQTLTGASTGTTVTNYGVTTIASTGNGTADDLIYSIAEPYQGARKTIIVDNGSTKLVDVRTSSSLTLFFGSTKNAVRFTTGSTGLPVSVDLVGISSAVWAVVDISGVLVDSTAGSTYHYTVLGATA